MTIGDVFAAISAAVFLIISWVALLLSAAYLLPSRVAAARERIEASPLRCGVIGLAAAVVGLIVTMFLYRASVGPGRLLPFLIVGAIIVAAAIGSAAFVQLIARRSLHSAPWAEPGYEATLRAAGVFVLACLCPIGGWMIVTPVALFVSLGAVVTTLTTHHAAKVKTQTAANPPSELAQAGQTV